jgi:dTDP-4-dehydrorhamnose reductase
MKVIIIGKSGQLANELVAEVPLGTEILSLGRDDVDITSFIELSTIVNKFKPSLIINASAYTAVDKAETEVDAAYALNKTAVEVIATVAKNYNVRLLHVSTDFVFDGKNNTAYEPLNVTAPIGVYGASKLAGEKAIKDIYPENSAVIRTSWVYSSYGSNFVKTMLRLMANKAELNIVSDQIGCPTYAKGLAIFLWKLSGNEYLEQTYHWSDSGVASWYDFAIAVHDIAIDNGLLKEKIIINPIPSSAYPTPAKRPHFSLLNTKGSQEISEPLYWRKQLQSCLNKIKSDA